MSRSKFDAMLSNITLTSRCLIIPPLLWWPSPLWCKSLIFFKYHHQECLNNPSFWIWGYVLHIEHISCVITNCSQHQWAIPSLFWIAPWALLEENITRKLVSLSLDLFFKILLFQVAFLISFSIAVFKIRSETCRTEAQFCQNLYMIKKESLPDRPQFCWSGSTVWHLFWRLLLLSFLLNFFWLVCSVQGTC